MKIATTVGVEDYVYAFFRKAATELGNTTPEKLMSQALYMYAGMVAAAILKDNGDNSQS